MSDMKLQLGIEIGDAALKLALFDPEAKKVLNTAYLATEVSPLDDIYTFESVLQAWLDQHGYDSVDTITLTLSVFRGVFRQIYIPPEASSNIKEYLTWKLNLLTGLKPDTFYFDYHVLRGDKIVGFTVVLIAVRRVWVDAVRKGFRSKKISPQIFELDVVSIFNLLKQDGVFIEDEVQAVIKVDVAGVVLMFFSQDDIKAIRSVSTLELVGKSKDDAFNLLSQRILEQVNLAASENGAHVKTLTLCGELLNDPSFFEIFKSKFDSYELKLLDFFNNIRLPVDEESVSSILSCVGAIGASLRSSGGAS